MEVDLTQYEALTDDDKRHTADGGVILAELVDEKNHLWFVIRREGVLTCEDAESVEVRYPME